MKIFLLKRPQQAKENIPAFISGMLVITACLLSTNLTTIGYDNKRIFQIITILLLLFSSPFIPTRYTEKNTRLTLLYHVLFFFSLTSSLIAASPKHALIEFITFIGLFVAVIYTAPAWKIKPFCFLAILSLLFSIAITEVVFFVTYLAYIFSGTTFSIHEFFPTFSNVRFFNQFQIWTMPYITVFLLHNHPTFKQYSALLWSIGIIWWLIFFSTGSRGAIVAELLIIVITWYFFKKEIKEFARVTVKLSFFGFVLYQLLFNLLPYIMEYNPSSLEIRGTTASRIFLWEKASKFIYYNPLFGIGPMHYAWSANPDLSHWDKIAHPHNSILQWGAEWGLFSLTIILMLILQALRKWFEKFNSVSLCSFEKNHSQLIIATTISVISAMIYSLFSGVIVMPTSQITAILPLSLMLFLYKPYNPKTLAIPRKGLNYFYKGAMVFTAILYFYLLIPDIISILFKQQDIIEIHLHYPRFWLQGNF